jgi:transcriptional regulator with XRE-family HTH domain
MTTPKDVIRQEFGRKLRRLLMEKGLTQSEFARLAAKHTNDGQFRRDLVSSYIHGRFAPSPKNLYAMAQTLDMEPEELLPQAEELLRRRQPQRLEKTVSLRTALDFLRSVAA